MMDVVDAEAHGRGVGGGGGGGGATKAAGEPRIFFLFLMSILPFLFHAKGDPKEPPHPNILIFIEIHYIFLL